MMSVYIQGSKCLVSKTDLLQGLSDLYRKASFLVIEMIFNGECCLNRQSVRGVGVCFGLLLTTSFLRMGFLLTPSVN